MTKTTEGDGAQGARSTEYAELWDTPDAKRERSPGKWDVYCAQCGRFVDSIASPLEPHAVRCRRCRAERCARCGVPLLPNEHIRDQGICHCSGPLEQRPSAADVASGASERHEPRAE